MILIKDKGISNRFFTNIITKQLYTTSASRNDIDKFFFCVYIMYNRYLSNNPISI